MNPVQQINKSAYDSQNVKNNVLSINLRVDGLSFVILEASNIVKAEYYEWQNRDWGNAIQKFTEIIQKHSELKKAFKKVYIFISSQQSTLIPNSFYSENKNTTVLETLLGINKNTFRPYSQQLKNADITLIYPLDLEIEKLINTYFPKAIINHESASFIDEAIKTASVKEKLYLNIGHQSFELIATKYSKLIAHNYFDYTTVDEFMFFLLSFVKQNNIPLKNLQLCISGSINMDSKIGKNLEKYFPVINKMSVSPAIDKEQIFAKLKNYTLVANS